MLGAPRAFELDGNIQDIRMEKRRWYQSHRVKKKRVVVKVGERLERTSMDMPPKKFSGD